MDPFPARCRLELGGAVPAEPVACRVELSADAVTVSPDGAPPLRVRLSELARWSREEYAVSLELRGGGRLVLSALGKRLEPFCKALPAARVEHLGQALLLRERGAAAEEAGEVRWRGEAAEPCRVRLQRTSLVAFPRDRLPFRVGLGEVRAISFDPGSYAVALELRGGRALELLRFGKRTDALRAGLAERRDALASRALRALGALAPGLEAPALRALGALLPDGLPAARAEVERAAPGAWESMLARAFAAGPRREAALHLAGRADQAWVAVKEVDPPGGGEEGEPAEASPPEIAEGAAAEGAGEEAAAAADEVAPAEAGGTLPDELAGRAILYLFRLGPALALEVPSSTESATYVFRAGPDAGRTVEQLAAALGAVQFRREPISLPEEALLGPRGARYGEALRLVPGLQAAREAFLGRAIHAGDAAWRKALEQALARA